MNAGSHLPQGAQASSLLIVGNAPELPQLKTCVILHCRRLEGGAPWRFLAREWLDAAQPSR